MKDAMHEMVGAAAMDILSSNDDEERKKRERYFGVDTSPRKDKPEPRRPSPRGRSGVRG